MGRKSQEWAIKLVPTRDERRLLDKAARADNRLTGPYCLKVALEAAAKVLKALPGPSNAVLAPSGPRRVSVVPLTAEVGPVKSGLVPRVPLIPSFSPEE